MSTTATSVSRPAKTDDKEPKVTDQSHASTDVQSQSERGTANGQPKRRPEKEFRVGSCRATIWCNEHKVKSGPNQQTTRIFRSVNTDRTFWNEKLKEGKGDWDSTYSFGLGDVHNLIRVAKLAARYLEQMEADVTRDA